jgi:hypothetical protein
MFSLCHLLWRSKDNANVFKELTLTVKEETEFSSQVFVVILFIGVVLYPKDDSMKTDNRGNMKCHKQHIFFELHFFIAVRLSNF